MKRICVLAMLWLAAGVLPERVGAGVNYEEAPINYSVTKPDNIVSRLQTRMEAGEVRLSFDARLGYLPAMLERFDVRPSSQILPFSKTSLQDDKIAPSTPRAIYFNDQIHIGFVQGGLIEIAVADPLLGMVFYTSSNESGVVPEFRRMTNNCLTCHGAARTRNVPGLMVRSVLPTADGHPVIAAGSTLSTPSSPIAKRWGGWYVTGTHGEETHLGNLILAEARKPKFIDNTAGYNVTDLSSRFDITRYLTPHSDIVALMVLEHQSEMYNSLTIAGFEARAALHRHRLALATADPDATIRLNTDLAKSLEKAATTAVKPLLFADETPLKSPIRGTSSFSDDFAQPAAAATVDHSLRRFNLESRLFQHRCSYLIDSANYKALPIELRREIARQIRSALGGETPPAWLKGTREEHAALLNLLEASGRLDAGPTN